MAYCAFCSHLIEQIVTPSQLVLDTETKEYEFEKDCDFKDSVAHCALCKFLYQRLEMLLGKQSSILDSAGKLRKIRLVNCYGHRYREGAMDKPLCRIDLSFPSLAQGPVAFFAAWTEIGKYLYF